MVAAGENAEKLAPVGCVDGVDQPPTEGVCKILVEGLEVAPKEKSDGVEDVVVAAAEPNDGKENEEPVVLGAVEELGKSELEPNRDVVGAVDVAPPNKLVPVVPVEAG